MHITSSCIRFASSALILGCIISVTGCDQAPPPKAETTPDSASTNTTATPDDNLVSSVAVKGNEALPPNHPPLPAPHPTSSVGTPSSLNQQLATLHPKQASKKKLDVAVPANVKGKWASATLAVTLDGAEKKLKLAIGETTTLKENIQLQLIHFLPAYTSDAQTVTSSSNKLINPAIQIQTISDGQVTAEGWVFQNLPEFNSFNAEQIKVRLVSAERTRKK